MTAKVLDQETALKTWMSAKAAWAALDGLIDVTEVPVVLEDALDAIFAVEVRAAIELRECGIAIPNPSREDLETARRFCPV